MKSMILLGLLLVCPSARADEMIVHIDNFTFTPAQIEVHPGATVRWDNRDDIPHTVTDAAAEKSFHSAALDTGDSFAFTFTAPGIYRYFCALHPHMQGTVIVK